MSVLGEGDAVVVKHTAGVGHEGRAVALHVHRHGALHTPQEDTGEKSLTRPTTMSRDSRQSLIASHLDNTKRIVPTLRADRCWYTRLTCVGIHAYLVVEGSHELLGVAGHDVGHTRGAHVRAVRPGALGVLLLTPQSYTARHMRHSTRLFSQRIPRRSSRAGRETLLYRKMDASYNLRTYLAGVGVRGEGAEARGLLDVHQRVGHAAARAARQSQRRKTAGRSIDACVTPHYLPYHSPKRYQYCIRKRAKYILGNESNTRVGTHHPALLVSQSTTCWGDRLRV